jgi:hypothetical protein
MPLPRYRQAYVLAATYSAGVMLPMGFEYDWSKRLGVVAADREWPTALMLSTDLRELLARRPPGKVWDWDRPGHIKEDIRRPNRFRRDNSAMREFTNLRFLHCADPKSYAFAKRAAVQSNRIVAVVNLDPHAVHEDDIELPFAEFGLSEDAEFVLEETFNGRVIAGRGARQRLCLDPAINPAMLFRLLPARKT